MCYSRSHIEADSKAADAARRDQRRTETIDTMVEDANHKAERDKAEKARSNVPAE